MKEYSCARLKEDVDYLAAKNIRKGCNCMVIERLPNKDWIAVFFNPQNSGDYAVAAVKEEYLTEKTPLPSGIADELKKAANRPDFFEHTELKQMRLMEHDTVELIAEKDKYARFGAHKGMPGMVISERAIAGKWCVLFPQPVGICDFDINIDEDDLKLLSRTKL